MDINVENLRKSEIGGMEILSDIPLKTLQILSVEQKVYKKIKNYKIMFAYMKKSANGAKGSLSDFSVHVP